VRLDRSIFGRGRPPNSIPIIFEYLRRYPEMAVDIVTEGRLVDIVKTVSTRACGLPRAFPAT